MRFVQNNPWIKGYALFKVLKEKNRWQSWEEWEDDLRYPSDELLDKLFDLHLGELSYHIFVQYFCFQQMENVKKRADKKKVYLKGDIPILLSRDSADVWLNQKLFLLQYAAGSPPDMYSKEGQYWGFPLYNWDESQRTNDIWWRTRIKVAEPFYHLYRIDHIVGFFRIWGIPLGEKANKGHFTLSDPKKWIPQGKRIMLMMLEASSMLPIGEDLGTVPPEVRICLQELGICGTKVMRWERYWDEDKRFIPIKDYIPESMTTVSTHDTEIVPVWWQKNLEDSAEDFAAFKQWPYLPKITYEQEKEILWDSHHTTSLFHINLLQEYLALVPGMSWDNLENEQINIPGVILKRNWSYRFRPSVEEIIANQDLLTLMQNIHL
jgi:4-alpha-glucanotransferase